MKLESFIRKLKDTPSAVEFNETMAVIEANYVFEPTAFTNGILGNEAGQNSGSCKLFAFAKKQALSEEETLACFGNYYEDVLNNPHGDSHLNIRNFMKTGFGGLTFAKEPLTEK